MIIIFLAILCFVGIACTEGGDSTYEREYWD